MLLLGRIATMENGKLLPVSFHCSNIVVVVVVVDLGKNGVLGVVKIGMGRLGDVGAVYSVVD